LVLHCTKAAQAGVGRPANPLRAGARHGIRAAFGSGTGRACRPGEPTRTTACESSSIRTKASDCV